MYTKTSPNVSSAAAALTARAAGLFRGPGPAAAAGLLRAGMAERMEQRATTGVNESDGRSHLRQNTDDDDDDDDELMMTMMIQMDVCIEDDNDDDDDDDGTGNGNGNGNCCL